MLKRKLLRLEEITRWKYLLFDLDGTLTDSREGIVNCIKYALEAMKKAVPPERELLKMLGPPLMDGFQEFAGLSYAEAERETKKYRERFGDLGIFENKLYDGMEQVLAALQKKGYVLIVATSKPEEYTVRVLEHFGIEKYFTEVVGSTMDGSRSTKGDIIREAFVRLGMTEEQKKTRKMVSYFGTVP